MVKFQSISVFVRVVTLRMKRAFLLLIHLLSFHIFAGSSNVSYVQVFRGQSITFPCNKYNGDLTLVTWNSSRYKYIHDVTANNTTSNFSLHRFNINTNFTSTLTINKAEDEDAGLYSCSLMSTRGTKDHNWNLSVTADPKPTKEPNLLWPLLHILTPISGLLLLLVCSSVVCFFLKCKNRSSTQELAPNSTLCPDPHSIYTEIQMVVPQPHDGSGQWFSDRQRSQYLERLNSIYDPIR